MKDYETPRALSTEEVKKIGKYKDWESMVVTEAAGKVCFAQSSPILQAPKSNKRDAKLFIAFRPAEQIIDEVLAMFPEKVAEYKSGKKGLLGMFVGEVMKRSKGKADPKITNQIIYEKLEA